MRKQLLIVPDLLVFTFGLPFRDTKTYDLPSQALRVNIRFINMVAGAGSTIPWQFLGTPDSSWHEHWSCGVANNPWIPKSLVYLLQKAICRMPGPCTLPTRFMSALVCQVHPHLSPPRCLRGYKFNLCHLEAGTVEHSGCIQVLWSM